jgi:hypothetical protein
MIDLFALYSSPNIIRVIKSIRQMGTLGGGVEVHVVFYWRNLREKDHLEDSGLDGRIILKWLVET